MDDKNLAKPKASNGSNKTDENIRQRGEKMKGDIAVDSALDQKTAARKVEKLSAEQTSNGTPPANDPGSHRRH